MLMKTFFPMIILGLCSVLIIPATASTLPLNLVQSFLPGKLPPTIVLPESGTTPPFQVHEGEITVDSIWKADKIHVIKQDVLVPKYKTLEVEHDAIIKFYPHTSIHVQGTMKGYNVFITSIHDDSIGGDTDQNGYHPHVSEADDYQISGPGAIEIVPRRLADHESTCGEVELRKDIGGRLVHGNTTISPLDQGSDPQVSLLLDQKQVSGWTPATPQWESTTASDGWHQATLTEHGQRHTESLAVLNNPNVVIHDGVMNEDEIWCADRLHVIRHWVRVPEGRTLTIESGTVIKTCSHAGLKVDGNLVARNVIFTTTDDDSVGGDTDLDGNQGNDASFDLIINGSADLTDSSIRHPDGITHDLIWTKGSVHVIHDTLLIPPDRTLTIQPGAIVKFATGAKLKAVGGTIHCHESIFTHLPDDSIGGDTEQDGDDTAPRHDCYELEGFLPPQDCELRYLTYLYAGWNLFAPGRTLLKTRYNRQLLRQCNAFSFDGANYVRTSLPVPAGSALWLYCQHPQVIPFDYDLTEEGKSGTIGPLQEDWNMAGLSGENSGVLSNTQADCAWEWNGNHYDLLQQDQNENLKLRSGRGYFINVNPQKSQYQIPFSKRGQKTIKAR